MADILDQKEEVIRVEMTKHGRKLLGLGLFSPKYFSFFDDSIIYDYSYYGNNIEEINSIHDRILKESLTFSSLNLLSNNNKNILGKSSPTNDSPPIWSLKFLNGKLEYQPNQSYYHKKIFNTQNIKCNLFFNDQSDVNSEIITENDYILIDLQELNLEDDYKNFEVELMYYDSMFSGSKSQIEKKLLFTAPVTNIINDYIYEESELSTKYFDIEFNEDHASYYFDVLVDEEIDTEYITRAGSGVYETIKGFVTALNNSTGTPIPTTGGSIPALQPGIIPGVPPVLPLDQPNNISPVDGMSIALSPSGDIISLNRPDPFGNIRPEVDNLYEGSVCRTNCCP